MASTTPRPLARDDAPGERWPVRVAHRATDEHAAEPACRRPVTHTYAVLVYLTGGRTRMEQAGRWDLAAGDALLVPAGQPHRSLERRGAEYWGLSFCVPCFAADGAARLLAPFERVRDGACPVVRIPSARRAFLDGLLRELADEGGEPGGDPEARAAVQRSLITLVLNEVERAAAATVQPARAGGGGVVIESLRFIERNCLRRLTLHDVAAAVGRSPAYVTSALTRATGRSAVAWIVSGRMAEARRLLLHSDEPVDAIAARVGYADATHFIRMFRRECGATPAAWRARVTREGGSPAR